MNWPHDADGDALRRLEKRGFDFTEETIIDFNIDFEHWPLPEDVQQQLQILFPRFNTIEPDEEGSKLGMTGYVQFKLKAKLTYELVFNTQRRVTEQMEPYGGWCESWEVALEKAE